jgi:hypothetical protein
MYKKTFKLHFEDKITTTEIKSDLIFGVEEAKKWLKEKHPTAKKIEHVKSKSSGGQRENAGRKKGEETKAIGKRVPIKYHSHFVKLVEIELKRLLDLEASQS